MSEPTFSLSLTVNDGHKALAFYAEAFGAKELSRMAGPEGGVAHAEFMFAGTKFYLSEESAEWNAFAMPEGQKSSSLIMVSTDGCDEAFDRATAGGSLGLMPPADMFWGARSAMVLDPSGFRWAFNQATEEISPDELDRRAKDALGERCP